MKKEWRFNFVGTLTKVLAIYIGGLLSFFALSLIAGALMTIIDFIFNYFDGQLKPKEHYMSGFKEISGLFFIVFSVTYVMKYTGSVFHVFEMKRYYEKEELKKGSSQNK